MKKLIPATLLLYRNKHDGNGTITIICIWPEGGRQLLFKPKNKE
jgi:hypothetical protein